MTGFGSENIFVASVFRRFQRACAEYTGGVDRVRLGRALGYGTRHAAKTVAAIAAAAAAEPGSGGKDASPSEATTVHGTSSVAEAQAPAARQTVPAPRQTIPATRQAIPAPRPAAPAARRTAPATLHTLAHGAGHLKRSFWGPLATFSGALWLRVTGLFFALIAVSLGGGAWRLREGIAPRLSLAKDDRFWVFAAFTLLFAYFAVSSFVRASLRERRAAPNARGVPGNRPARG